MASTTAPEPSRASAVNSLRRVAGQPVQVRLRVALELAQVGHGQHVDLAALLAQQPRHHQPVAAVVALADHDPDRPGPGGGRRDARQPLPRALHQVQRRHALGVDGPGVHVAHLLRLEQRVEPVRQRGHSARATAPAVVSVWVSDRRTVTPSSSARAPAAAAQAHVRRAAGGHHLDVGEVPALQRQRLGHRLLGAEAGGQVLARAGLGAAYSRSAAVNRRSAMRGRRSSTRSNRSISSRSSPSIATRP